MMMNLLKYILLTFLLSFAACSSDDDGVPSVPNGQPQPGDALEITVSAADFVTDGTPDTRATDDGKETTFDDNDRVGVIILDEKSRPIYDNIPYKYDSSNKKWVFDDGDGKGGCYYDPKAETYIVYYPYSRAADGVTSKEDLKTIFAPKFNQSDIKDYRASDLMVWNRKGHLASSVTTLDAELKHAFASIYLAPTVKGVILDDGDDTSYTGSYASEVTDISNISDVSLTIDNTVYVPFHATNGSLCCIVPAGITPGDIRCFYTIGGKTYGNTINISGTGKVAANTRYACQPEIKNVTYSLSNAHVGDFYCKKNGDEGYLIPGDFEGFTDDQKNACLGIVFWVGDEALQQDPLLRNKYPDCSHGLVVALQDAALNSSTMNWSKNYEYVQNSTDNIYKNDFNIQEANKMCGYSNTLALKAYNTKKGADNELRVLPCDAIEQYSKDNPAPANSSGWYFPSVMELQYVCWGQGQGEGTTGRDRLNIQISKVSGGSPFPSFNYWSSTEFSYYSYGAWYVYFASGYAHYYVKDYNAFRVRPLLAF